jgi:hypothetical protein
MGLFARKSAYPQLKQYRDVAKQLLLKPAPAGFVCIAICIN